jgi:hypothetical protein
MTSEKLCEDGEGYGPCLCDQDASSGADETDDIGAGGASGASDADGEDEDEDDMDSACMDSSTCEVPHDLGIEVRFDEGSDELTINRTLGGYFLVKLREANGSPLAEDGSAVLDLIPPPGADYDLYVYESEVPNQQPFCDAGPSQWSTYIGNEREVVDWYRDTEDVISNGSDDSHYVIVAVVHKSGPCGPDADPYELIVTGNDSSWARAMDGN